MKFSYFMGKFKNDPFCPNLGQLYIACGFHGFQLNLFILPNYVLIFPNCVSSYISIFLNKKVSSCFG